MKRPKLNITFHNPNSPEDTKELAESFFTQMAMHKLHRLILEQGEENDRINNSKSEEDLGIRI